MKVSEQDGIKYIMNEEETRLTQPTEIQSQIDTIIEEFAGSKALISLSCNSDSELNVYIEAETEEDINQIAKAIGDLFWQIILI